jgi:hypothetical protein
MNVDLADHSNPLEYFELFCTPEIVEVIARETNQHAQKFLENTPNLNLRSRTHHWKEINRNEMMNLLAFLLLQGLHQNLDNKSCFSQRKILETPVFLDMFSERRFHLLLTFFMLLTTKRVGVMKQGRTAKTVGWPCVLHPVSNVTIW